MFTRIKNGLLYLVLIVSLGLGIRYAFDSWRVQDGGNQSTDALFAASLPNEKGVQQSLSQYKSKIVVLNFWATWCPPCREEMPELSKLYQAHKDHNVAVLGLAIDDVKTVADFQKENPVSYPLFSAEMQGMDLAAGLGNNKGVLPYTVIIDAQGRVAKTYLGRISQALLEQTLREIQQKN